MSRLGNAINEIHELDEMSGMDTRIHQLHPSIKLIITFGYIALVVSYDKYNILGLLPMLLYPLMIFKLSQLKVKHCFMKLRFVLPVICFIGIFNPLLDHTVLLRTEHIVIYGGVISMLTLIIKGIYTLMASYLLIATTGMEGICYALKRVHVPDMIVMQILLLHRYLILLLEEANAIFEAYSLRAPGQRGIHYRVWGPLLGQLMFRSIDRANELYDSMLLRGFHGNYPFQAYQKCTKLDYSYFLLWFFILASMHQMNLLAMMARYIYQSLA